MTTKMLINSTRAEQLRVAIVDGTILQEYQVEIAEAGLTRGNIYRGTVANVQPSLNAAFVDLGEERHGFLPVADVQPTSYHKAPPAGVKRPRIDQVLEKGKPILVQVTKDGVGQKGPALNTNLAIAGRYLVLTPYDSVRGISRKAPDDEARKKVRDRLKKLSLPDGHGVIVRTNGLDQNQTTLNRDLSALLRLWRRISTEADKGKGPKLVYSDQDLVVQALRDYLDPHISQVVVDDDEVFARVEAYMKAFLPRSKTELSRYRDRLPLFSRYRLETQIDRIYERSASLPSGGSIVIDQTEALTAIDVNSGRATKTSNHDESIFKINCEAAEEAARQLRLRDIGGLVVVDFIDMRLRKHQNKLERMMRDAMKPDKARWSVGRISSNGLLEINRQRIKQALRLRTHRPCPTCQGIGSTPTPEFAALRLLSRIEARAASNLMKSVTLGLHPEVADTLQNQFRSHLALMETEHLLQIEILASPNLSRTEERIEWVQREGGEVVPIIRSAAVQASDLAVPSRRGRRTSDSEDGDAPKTGRRRRRRSRSKDEEPTSAGTPEVAEETGAKKPSGSPKDDESEKSGSESKRPRRSRRSRRRKKPSDSDQIEARDSRADETPDEETRSEDTSSAQDSSSDEEDESSTRRPRRRSRRRGGRGRGKKTTTERSEETAEARDTNDGDAKASVESKAEATGTDAEGDGDSETPKSTRSRSRRSRRGRSSSKTSDSQDPAAEESSLDGDEPTAESAKAEAPSRDGGGETASKTRTRRRRSRGRSGSSSTEDEEATDTGDDSTDEKPARAKKPTARKSPAKKAPAKKAPAKKAPAKKAPAKKAPAEDASEEESPAEGKKKPSRSRRTQSKKDSAASETEGSADTRDPESDETKPAPRRRRSRARSRTAAATAPDETAPSGDAEEDSGKITPQAGKSRGPEALEAGNAESGPPQPTVRRRRRSKRRTTDESPQATEEDSGSAETREADADEAVEASDIESPPSLETLDQVIEEAPWDIDARAAALSENGDLVVDLTPASAAQEPEVPDEASDPEAFEETADIQAESDDDEEEEEATQKTSPRRPRWQWWGGPSNKKAKSPIDKPPGSSGD